MTRLLILAAALSMGASHAVAACDFHNTASNVDTTKVASVTNEDPQTMSTPASRPTIVIEKDAAAAVESK